MATSDHSRVLAPRGVADAHNVGSFVASHLPMHCSIYCSTAARTRQTAEIIASYFPNTASDIQFESDLYTFSCADLETFIQSRNEDEQSIILFGHNEAITNFVNKFGSISVSNVPTAGFVQLDFAKDTWKNLEKGTTTRIQFPTDLH